MDDNAPKSSDHDQISSICSQEIETIIQGCNQKTGERPNTEPRDFGTGSRLQQTMSSISSQQIQAINEIFDQHPCSQPLNDVDLEVSPSLAEEHPLQNAASPSDPQLTARQNQSAGSELTNQQTNLIEPKMSALAKVMDVCSEMSLPALVVPESQDISDGNYNRNHGISCGKIKNSRFSASVLLNSGAA